MQWTENFNCSREIEFWCVILDNPFEIDEIKAKRRYKNKKGIKNFYVRKIIPKENVEQLYDVYLGYLKGNESPTVSSKEKFLSTCVSQGMSAISSEFSKRNK